MRLRVGVLVLGVIATACAPGADVGYAPVPSRGEVQQALTKAIEVSEQVEAGASDSLLDSAFVGQALATYRARAVRLHAGGVGIESHVQRAVLVDYSTEPGDGQGVLDLLVTQTRLVDGQATMKPSSMEVQWWARLTPVRREWLVSEDHYLPADQWRVVP